MLHPEYEAFSRDIKYTPCPRSGCGNKGQKHRRWRGWSLCDYCWPRNDAQAAALFAELDEQRQAIIADVLASRESQP